MNFQNLGGLAWLIPLDGIIIVLYLLRMRRKDFRVPATFLWPERIDEVRANSLFQKLRFNWLLVLQLLALTLLVIAVAKPQTRQNGLTGEVTVLVIDASASMGASDIKPTRFDEAVRLAREAIRGAKAGDRIALIEAGPQPRVVFPLSSDPAKQLRALETVKRADADADVGEALRLAAALVGSQASARIVLLSDGVFEPIKNFSRGKAALVYQCIGESAENVAISALGVADTPQGRQLYCGVKSYSKTPMNGVLNLYSDGKLVDSTKFVVAPTKTWGQTIAAPAGAQVFEAKLEAPDVLKADNYAVCLANPGASLRVLLVGKGDFFLERALALDPRVTLDRATALPAEEQAGSGQSRYDLIVFDGEPEAPVKARGVLTFGSAGKPSPVTVQGEAKGVQFLSSTKSPVMDSVDFTGVYIDRSERVSAKANGEVLATSNSGPLVVAATGTQRHLYVAFEPLLSDFPLQIGFPIFIANALDFLGGTGTTGALAVHAGSAFSIPASGPAVLAAPDGSKKNLSPVGGSLIVRDATTVGRYDLEAGGKTRAVYASLNSERASNIEPVRQLDIGGGTVRAVSSPSRFADFWRPLILLGLLVLTGEWWLFARRS